MTKLTAVFIKTTTAPGKYHDGLNGLILNIAKGGSKSWIQRTNVNGKRCEIGLGSVKLVSLREARQKAEDNKRAILEGGDPLADRRAAQGIPTFEEVAIKFIAKKKLELKNAKSFQQWPNTMATYVYPVLGRKKVDAITAQDVLQCVEPIWADKNETARRVIGRIENILGAAKAAGHRTGDNPATYKNNLENLLPKLKRNVVHHPAVAQTDMVRWWSLLSTRKGTGADALRFTTMCAGRTTETLEMTWGEVDMEAGVWIIPAGRMKRDKAHSVVLNAEAMEILRKQPQGAPEGLVFHKDGKRLSEAVMRTLMKKMDVTDTRAGNAGFKDEESKRVAVPHGLRATFRSWCEDNGKDENLAEKALSHAKGNATDKAYQRGQMIDRRRVLMTEWHRALCGDTEAQVVKLHG